MTLNAHKIHGPKGIGALYIRKGVKIFPMMHGGGHEKGLRSGTENLPAIVGFAKAVETSNKKDAERTLKLRDKLLEEILKISGSSLNGSKENRLCNNINVSFGDVEGEAIGSSLDFYGISISTGSACASNKLEKSHVLKAIGKNSMEINSSIRISLSKFTQESEIKEFISKLTLVIERLRKISPFAK
jgi:cysteine desulfurase